MTPRRRPWISLEQLEDRMCPALSLFFANGTLTVRGVPTTDLTISQPADNVLNVNDGGVDLGTYAVTGDLRVFLTRFDEDPGLNDVEVDLMGNTFSGDIQIDLGEGDATPVDDDPVSIFDGAVGGDVALRNGSGKELALLGDQAGGPIAPVSIGGNVLFTGRRLFDPFLTGEALVLAAGSSVQGSIFATQVDVITIGDTANGPASVARDVVINDSGSPLGLTLTLIGAVGGSLTTVGGNPADQVEVGDSATPTTIGGNLTASLGGAVPGFFPSNLLVLRDLAVVAGNVTYVGGNDDDDLLLFGDIAGSLVAVLGNGSNRVDTFDDLLTLQSLSVAGSVNILGGNGADFIGDLQNVIPSDHGFTAAVGGSLALNLGGGTNTFDFRGDLGASAGGPVSYTGGSGVDTVRVRGSNGFAFSANLGAGADEMTIDLGTGVGSAVIDFGVDFDLDVWNPPAGGIGFNLILRNFP